MVLWHRGLGDVAAWYLDRSIGDYHHYQQRSDMIGMLVPTLITMFVTQMFLCRHKGEEKMLREHFGKEWNEYAAKRWRFIPYVY